MDYNPLPELPKEDPYYTHCRKTCADLVAEQNQLEWERESRANSSVPFVSSPPREVPKIAGVLSWVGFFVMALLLLAQTNDWATILIGGAIGALAGNILGRILHFINAHKLLFVVAGIFGYLYFSNHLAVLGIG